MRHEDHEGRAQEARRVLLQGVSSTEKRTGEMPGIIPVPSDKGQASGVEKWGGTVKTDYKKLVRKLAEADKECTRAKKALHQHNAFWCEEPGRYGRDNCEQVRMGGGVCCHGKTDFDPDTGKPIYAGDWPVDEWCEFCRIRQPLYLAVRAASRKRSWALQSVLRAGRREMEARRG